MADLFTRLAEHSLGLAPTVQPVVAPLFATPAPGGAGTRLTPAEGQGIPVIEEYLPASPSTQAGGDALGAGRFASAGPSPVTPPQTEPKRPASGDSNVSRHQAPAPYFQPLLPPFSRQGEGTPARLSPETNESQDERGPSSALGILRQDPASTRVGSLEAAGETMPSVGLAEPARREPRSRDEARTINIQSLPGLERDAPPGRRFHPAEEAAATIHVSIGRIEVRAIHAPAQTPARPQPVRQAPALSLDEYLKQQKGGRR